MKRHNNFFYLLGQGVKSTFKHGFMSFAAVCITVACLVIINSFVLICYNLNGIVDEMQEKARVLVVVEHGYSEQEAKHLGTQINLIENVKNAVFRSNVEAFEEFASGHEDHETVFEGVETDFMRHQISVTLEDNSLVEKTTAEIERIEGVEYAKANFDLANMLATIRTVLYVAAVGITAMLLFVSLLIISNTIRLTMMDRKEEIAIMKMVGATNGFIRLPFVVEGFLLGLFGAAFSFFIEWGLYEIVCNAIADAQIDWLHFAPFSTVLIPMAIVCGAAGFFIGIFGSLMSIRRFLKV